MTDYINAGKERIVLSEYIIANAPIKVKKIGDIHFGCCPFCGNEEMFSINDKKKYFHCFNCGENGDVITFEMKYNCISFTEATIKVLDSIGMDHDIEPNNDVKNDIKYCINEDANRYFISSLKSSEAYKYFKDERTLDDETIYKFELGYCSYDGLYEYLKNKGYNHSDLTDSGLFSCKDGRISNRFKNRAMFPIRSVDGKVVGFGGRVMGDYIPKYLNSPDSFIFDKSQVLYGIDKAKKSKRDFMIICEGYMDVIAMHKAGFTEAVASLGTALTDAQVSLIKRYTDKVFICYDMDDAGKEAAIKAVKQFDRYNIQTKIVDMNPYKDADELLRKGENFCKRLNNAKPPLFFETDYYIENPDKLNVGERAYYWLRSKGNIEKYISKKYSKIEIKTSLSENTKNTISALRSKQNLRDFVNQNVV